MSTAKVIVSVKDIHDDFIKLFEESEPKVEKIKYKVIGTSLTTIIDGKTIVKKSTKEEIEAIKVDIEKYNKLEGKFTTGISDKLKAKIIAFVQAESVKEQTERENKISKLKVEKKILSKKVKEEPNSKKTTSEEKPKLTIQEMIDLERESLKWLRRSDAGYIHPVTGRRWDGEKYR